MMIPHGLFLLYQLSELEEKIKKAENVLAHLEGEFDKEDLLISLLKEKAQSFPHK